MSLTPPPLSLRQLQYAVAVAETRNFRRAAAACHVSQPSLSAQIAELEGALGVRLFERDRRRVLVTSAGEELLSHARRILLDTNDLVEVARRARDPLVGVLRLGVIPTISPYLLPSIAPVLRKRFPQLMLRWTEDKTDVLVQELHGGNLDGAVLALEAHLGDVEHEVIAIDPFVLAAAQNHPLLQSSAPVQASDLKGAHFLLLDDGHCLRDQSLAYCSKAHINELDFRATSLSTLVQMVALGTGVTLLPEIALPLETRNADLATREFRDPAPHRTLAMIWRERSPLASSLRQIASTIRAAYPSRAREPRKPSRTKKSTTHAAKKRG